MNTLEFLSHLRKLGVQLTVEDEKLYLNAPEGVLTPALKTELKERKIELLTFIQEQQQTEVAVPPPIYQAEHASTVPLSFAQRRLWFLTQMMPDSPVYNVPMVFRLSGSLDVAALEQSLADIVQRHEILRTTFPLIDNQPVQAIAETVNLSLPLIDLRQLAAHDREVEAEALIVATVRQPFNLAEESSLLRISLLCLTETQHILVISAHHIIFDGWSFEVFCQELSLLYDAYYTQTSASLPELPIQYADFSLWHQAWLQGQTLESQLAYWKQQLDPPPPALQLPTDRPRPAIQTGGGAWHTFRLSPTLPKALKTLSQQEGATLFMTLLAAFKALLFRYTNQDDLVVGTPIANRGQAELEGLIGVFVNMLALRARLSGQMSFRELLAQVRTVALEAYAHQDLPFERLVDELQVERALSHAPLFQVVFMFQNTPPPTLVLAGLTVETVTVNTNTAKFDLTLNLVETPAGLEATIEYNTDMFDLATIERMAGHFQTLLEGIVADPDQPLSQLSLLTEAERHQLLIEWNDTRSDYPRDVCAHQLFEAQVEQTPTAIAIAAQDEQLTYQALNRQANQVAHHLRTLGVGSEKLVAICVERSPEMVVAILGALKAGGAYLPLDPKYPQERLAFMLQDAQAPVLLTQERLIERLPITEAKIICLDSAEPVFAHERQDNPSHQTKPHHLAYVIYTSGSTGVPKGVQIEHTSLVNLITWHQRVYKVTAADRSTHLAGPAFDASVWELWPYLTVGATIYIPNEETVLSPPQLLEWLVAESITITFLPTPLAETILEETWPTEAALRVMLTGGDRLRRVAGQALPFTLVNNYGPTENTVVTTWTPVPIETGADVPPPIGRPIFNTQVYLLDPYLQPTPIGVPGELYISGVGLARGYLNRPELTAERFIRNPFSDEPEMCLYKTGDLARYRPDGNIEFLGRIDGQIKIRGFRIELGEIEAVLGRYPAIREVIVIDQEYTPGDKRLIAYLVPRQRASVTPNELRNFLKKSLPNYMIPANFVFLETLPLTPNGKIDRQRLPAPDPAMLSVETEPDQARDLLELQLVRIWQEVLHIEQVGTKDNFFDLGGQSLLAVRLMNKITKITGRKLPLAALFQAPTIEQQAKILRHDGWEMPSGSLVAIQANGSKPPLFFVPGNFGNVFTDLGDLALHLPPDQPFYGLQDNIENPSQVKAMAADYLKEIKQVQPEGPYYLGGVCSGGLVAFEMAHQLNKQGDEVGLVALVETFPHEFNLRSYLTSLAAISRRLLRRLIPEEGVSNAAAPESLFKVIHLEEQGSFLRIKAKVVANMLGAAGYNPRIYPGRVDVFFTDESIESKYKPHLRWEQLTTEGAEIHRVPGTHDSITGDHGATIDRIGMKILAAEVKMCLDRALKNGKRDEHSVDNRGSLASKEQS